MKVKILREVECDLTKAKYKMFAGKEPILLGLLMSSEVAIIAVLFSQTLAYHEIAIQFLFYTFTTLGLLFVNIRYTGFLALMVMAYGCMAIVGISDLIVGACMLSVLIFFCLGGHIITGKGAKRIVLIGTSAISVAGAIAMAKQAGSGVSPVESLVVGSWLALPILINPLLFLGPTYYLIARALIEVSILYIAIKGLVNLILSGVVGTLVHVKYWAQIGYQVLTIVIIGLMLLERYLYNRKASKKKRDKARKSLLAKTKIPTSHKP